MTNMINEKLKSMIYRNAKCVDSASVDLQTDMNLIKDLGYDSLALMSLFLDVEVEFGVDLLEEDEIENLIVVGNLCKQIDKSLQ